MHNLDAVKYYVWLRSKCLLTHDEIRESALIDAMEADLIASQLEESGVTLPEIDIDARREHIRRFFEQAVEDLSRQEVPHA